MTDSVYVKMSTCVCVCDTMTFTDLVMLGFNFLSVVNGCVCTYLYTGICDTMTFSWPCEVLISMLGNREWLTACTHVYVHACMKPWPSTDLVTLEFKCLCIWRCVRRYMCMRVWHHDIQLTLWRWNFKFWLLRKAVGVRMYECVTTRPSVVRVTLGFSFLGIVNGWHSERMYVLVHTCVTPWPSTDLVTLGSAKRAL